MRLQNEHVPRKQLQNCSTEGCIVHGTHEAPNGVTRCGINHCFLLSLRIRNCGNSDLRCRGHFACVRIAANVEIRTRIALCVLMDGFEVLLYGYVSWDEWFKILHFELIVLFDIQNMLNYIFYVLLYILIIYIETLMWCKLQIVSSMWCIFIV